METAIEQMEANNNKLSDDIDNAEADPSVWMKQLHMKLSGILDPAVQGGIANYEKVIQYFFSFM